jgi:hypothetical protein
MGCSNGARRPRQGWTKLSVLRSFRILEADHVQYCDAVKALLIQYGLLPDCDLTTASRLLFDKLVQDIIPSLPRLLRDIRPPDVRSQVLWDLAQHIRVYPGWKGSSQTSSRRIMRSVPEDEPAPTARENPLSSLVLFTQNWKGNRGSVCRALEISVCSDPTDITHLEYW